MPVITRERAKEFFRQRFERNPDHDKNYFEEWYERLNSPTPETYMDSESLTLYRKMFKLPKDGRGWHGDTPGHRKAALKAERNGAINEPIKTKGKKTSKGWVVTRLTLQNRPSAWMKFGTKGSPIEEIVIDITNPDTTNRGYPVYLYRPNQSFPKQKVLLGTGYAINPKNSWDGAYEYAREIAMNYMNNDERLLGINEPIKTGRAQAKHTYLQGYIINGMKFTLVGVEYTETKADKKAIQYAKDNKVAEVKKAGDEYLIYVSEQYAPTKAHRKLTEKERDRMINMHASAPLTYRPEIDDELIKLGLAQFWDNMPDAVENTDMPFYAHNGGILPEWYDFKAETAQYEAERAKYTPPYRVDVWEERDRLIITVYDSKDKEVASWVDEEAREMFENGFFESKKLEESVLGYLTDIGTIRKDANKR